MTSKKSMISAIVLGALILGPIALAFNRELEALPGSLRMLCTSLTIAILIFAGGFLRTPLQQLGRVKYGLLGVTLLIGLVLGASSRTEFESADFAQVQYSNGSQTDGVKPATIYAWGRMAGGYNLHPAYEAAVVPNALVTTFLSQPKKVRLLVAKPQSALFQPDGTPTASDGISLEISAFDVSGKLGYSKTLTISQEDFLKKRWVEKAIRMDTGIASIKVRLTSGPPGSTPSFDSTIIGFQVSNLLANTEAVGKVMLICLGFFVLALFLVLNVRALLIEFSTRRHAAATLTVFYCALIFSCLVLIAYWSESRTSYVFFWDFRNYWEKTEALYELIKAGSWMQAFSMFASAYASDYSMLPTVAPALSSLVTGYPTRLNYSLSITVLYAVPAYIMVAYLSKRLLDGHSRAVDMPISSGWILASLPVLFGLPLYFGTTLFLMPDIGGVVLFSGALLSASTLVDAIREQPDHAQPGLISNTLFRSSISLGVLFSLMFIFRRWYVFAAAGIACAVVMLISIEILRAGVSRRKVMARAFTSALLTVFAALPLLCWVLFSWSRDFGQHNYSNLYASYQFSLAHDAQAFKDVFGVAAPLLCIVGGGFIYVLGKAKPLFFLLTLSTVIACALFLHVQSPGRHHFFLLMPLLGAFLAGLSILIARRFGFMASVCLTLILVVGGALATRPLSTKYGITIFASLEDSQPKHQIYATGFAQMSEWLASSENENKTFCLVASSPLINQGIFGELWQILPNVARHAYDQRLIQLGQVDSVNGPPMPIIKECQIFLVGVPFQTHMAPGQQYTLEIIQKDMVNGTGVGLAVERTPRIFSMGDNIEMQAYQTIRNITDEEYDDLVKRYLDSKNPGRSALVDKQ